MKLNIYLGLKILLALFIVAETTYLVTNAPTGIVATAVNQAKDEPSPAPQIQSYSMVTTYATEIGSLALLLLFSPEILRGLEKLKQTTNE